MSKSIIKFASSAILATGIAVLGASTALAGGLDRVTYSPNILFEKGNLIEGSGARVSPNVSGSLGPVGIPDISPDYTLLGFGAKFDISDRMAVAFQTFENVGANILYTSPPYPVPIEADLQGRAYVGTVKFDLSDNFAVFGGLKHVVVGGDALNVALAVGVPGPLEFERNHGTGYIVGAAYSKPEIALRVSLTYESSIDIDLATSGAIVGTTTAIIPEAWELYAQTGIAAGTLLFGSVRHTSWSGANINLVNNPAFPITDFSDSLTWTLGVGKQLSEKLSVSLSGSYEASDGEPSTLQPTGDKFTLGVGTKVVVFEGLEWSAGVSHTWLGDNETDAPISAPFQDNHAWVFGTKVALRF